MFCASSTASFWLSIGGLLQERRSAGAPAPLLGLRERQVLEAREPGEHGGRYGIDLAGRLSVLLADADAEPVGAAAGVVEVPPHLLGAVVGDSSFDDGVVEAL